MERERETEEKVKILYNFIFRVNISFRVVTLYVCALLVTSFPLRRTNSPQHLLHLYLDYLYSCVSFVFFLSSTSGLLIKSVRERGRGEIKRTVL